jgi:hypothetical protein
VFRILGKSVLQVDKTDERVNYHFPFLSKFKRGSKLTNDKPVFYLKINRNDNYAFLCLQHWLYTIEILDADFYIICDKDKLERQILKRIVFKNGDIKFIKSVEKPLCNIVKNIATKNWVKAAHAHLTTFWHAKRNNIENFWNIDADDTMFLAKPEIVADILKRAQSYADKNDLNTFSLDMWWSRTAQKHWSFGVTYTRQNVDWFEVFNRNQDTNWQNHYREYACEFNVDYFFTYLKDFMKLKIETFYVENCYFVHWGDFLTDVIASSICFWENGKLAFPILLKIYEDTSAGIIPISDDCVKFDLNIKKEDCIKFALNNLPNLKYFKEETQKLWGIEKLCSELEAGYENI